MTLPARCLAALLTVSSLACDDDGGDEAAATSTTTVASGTAATAVTTASSSSSTSAADSSSGGAGGMPQCVKACLFPGECCPPGAKGCPSSGYPYNFSCVDGLCVAGGCSTNAECGGGFSCLTISGVGTCVAECSEDPDCAFISGAAVCTGVSDANEGYCFEPCTDPSITCGNSVCDEASGQCTCTSPSQCIVGFECV